MHPEGQNRDKTHTTMQGNFLPFPDGGRLAASLPTMYVKNGFPYLCMQWGTDAYR